MINGEDWIEASHDRLLGYRQALTTHDVAVDPALIVSGGWTLASGREQAHRLLDLPNPPTAMFCYCDRMALGAYEAVLSRGLKIPDDISIVGYGDESFAADMHPALTTVVLPHEEMARWAVLRLLQPTLSTSENARPMKLKMECKLVGRGSIANSFPTIKTECQATLGCHYPPKESQAYSPKDSIPPPFLGSNLGSR